MRKIAIIRIENVHEYYDYDMSEKIIRPHITDWTEVDEDTFKLLKRAKDTPEIGGFIIVEQPTNQSDYIKKTVDEYVTHTRILAEKNAEKKRLEEIKREQDAEKRKAKRLEAIRKEAEILMQELSANRKELPQNTDSKEELPKSKKRK